MQRSVPSLSQVHLSYAFIRNLFGPYTAAFGHTIIIIIYIHIQRRARTIKFRLNFFSGLISVTPVTSFQFFRLNKIFYRSVARVQIQDLVVKQLCPTILSINRKKRSSKFSRRLASALLPYLPALYTDEKWLNCGLYKILRLCIGPTGPTHVLILLSDIFGRSQVSSSLLKMFSMGTSLYQESYLVC